MYIGRVKLFPSKELSIETTLSKSEVIERLNSLKRPKPKGFWESQPEHFTYIKPPEKRYYLIKVSGNLFTIYIDDNIISKISGLGFDNQGNRKTFEFMGSPRIYGEILTQEEKVIISFSFKTPESLSLVGKYFLICLSIYIIVLPILIIYSFLKGNGDLMESIIIMLFMPIFLVLATYLINKYSLNYLYNKMKPFLTKLFEAE